ncbi:MAG TPA: hypothetical protein VIU15_03245 [Streptomyces sp.]
MRKHRTLAGALVGAAFLFLPLLLAGTGGDTTGDLPWTSVSAQGAGPDSDLPWT